MRKIITSIKTVMFASMMMGMQMGYAQVATYSISERFGWSTGAKSVEVAAPLMYDKAYSPFTCFVGIISPRQIHTLTPKRPYVVAASAAA